MKVYLKATGMMGRFLGSEPREIVLPDGAALEDLLDYFGRHLTPHVPEYVWNERENRFRGPVVITIDGKVARDSETPLEDGQEIAVFKAFVGG